MNIYKYSAKKFSSLEDIPFSPEDYSKYKHGSKRISRLFGTELGNSFLRDRSFELCNLKSKDIVISSAPYNYIPVASTILKDYFFSSFNSIWGLYHESPSDLKIFRGHNYIMDYSNMEYEDRLKAINSDEFYIDKEYIKNKTLFLIDDIRITGSHEETMIKMLERIDFQGDVYFLYYAELIDTKAAASIEGYLNHAFVKNILHINHIIQNDEFIFNTRVTKFILSQSHEDFKNFIDYQSKSFRHTLKTNSMGNSYHKKEEFKENFNYLTTKI